MWNLRLPGRDPGRHQRNARYSYLAHTQSSSSQFPWSQFRSFEVGGGGDGGSDPPPPPHADGPINTNIRSAKTTCIFRIAATSQSDQAMLNTLPRAIGLKSKRVLACSILFVIFVQENDFRFGSLAAPQHDISPTAASGGKADTRQRDSDSPRLNVRFQPKRSFKRLYFSHAHRLLSARSGPQSVINSDSG